MTTSADAATDDASDLTADVVVIGAGHNGLITAAYLAAAGLEVVVLEAEAMAGGNTRTEELTLPGFAHDSCSSAHVLIQSNPVIRDDELGLLAEHGLEYVTTDPAVVLPQPDGELLVMHRDLDATAHELSRWSARDADAFTDMVREWRTQLAPVHARWSSALPLGEGDAVRAYLDLRARSAWDVVHERFTTEAVRSFVLWLAMATIQDPRRPGSGFLPASLTAGRLSYGWATPRGGSGALPAALVRHLEAHGGQVICSSPVRSIERSAGRATAVRTADGRRIQAREGVVSSAHLALVAQMLAAASPASSLSDSRPSDSRPSDSRPSDSRPSDSRPSDPGPSDPVLDPGSDLNRARDQWQPGLSVFAVHAALRGDLSFDSPNGPVAAVAAGLGGSAGMVAQIDAMHRGEPDARDPWVLVVDQTVVDPSRAVDGGATFKILTIAPYDRSDGRSWDDTKLEYAEQLVGLVRARASGLDAGDILAMRAESPVDVLAHNPHNLGGSCHGGEFRLEDGSVIAGWPTYSTSVPRLFLTGSTTHPGGSVSGRPGRNAARAVLTELGIDPATVMGPT